MFFIGLVYALIMFILISTSFNIIYADHRRMLHQPVTLSIKRGFFNIPHCSLADLMATTAVLVLIFFITL